MEFTIDNINSLGIDYIYYKNISNLIKIVTNDIALITNIGEIALK